MPRSLSPGPQLPGCDLQGVQRLGNWALIQPLQIFFLWGWVSHSARRCCNALETELALVQQAISIQRIFYLLQVFRREQLPVAIPGTHDPLSRSLDVSIVFYLLPKQKLCDRELYPLSCVPGPGSFLMPSLEESSGISQASNIRSPKSLDGR